MSSAEQLPQTRAERRRAQQGRRGPDETPARPALEAAPARPRPVVAAATMVLGLAVAVASTATEHSLLIGVVALCAVLVAVGLPRLVGLVGARASSVVLLLTTAGLVAARMFKEGEPLLELVPFAAAGGFVMACLTPLVSAAARRQLTWWLSATSLGVLLLVSGFVLTGVSDARRPVIVAAVAIAVSAVVEVIMTRGRARSWLLPVTMVVGGIAGLVVELAVRDEMLVWAVLVGVLAAGIALALRQVLAQLPRIDEPVGSIATGAASLLVVGPVVLTLARVFLG
ncbi:hypothetical protein [Marihabitans asiaticum]|nr:hypothetical protein [Marihabitans asiaticum]